MRSASSSALPTAVRRLGRAALVSFLALLVIPLWAIPAQAQLVAVGPVDPANGYPSYYEDVNGLRLVYCFDPGKGCHADIPDPASPASFPDNFPTFAAYQLVEIPRGDWTFSFALQGTFENGAVVDGDQAVFVSMQVRHRGGTLTPGDVYTITHPFGDFAATVDELGDVDLRIESRIAAGDFQTAANAWLGDAAGRPAPFLTWDTFGTGVDEPAPGTVGNPETPHAITGSPFGTNFFRAEGPGGVFQTSLFLVQGHLSLTGPVATAPAHSIEGVRMGASTAPVRLRWGGVSPTGNGTLTSELQRSVNGGAFTAVPLADPTATTTTLQLANGTYRFRVRVTDSAGNTSGFATGPAFAVRILDQNDPSVAYTGAWTNASLAGAFGGSVRHASVAGSVATLTFTGSNVAWVSTRGPDRGRARVLIDGVRVATIDLFAAAQQTRRVVFRPGGLGAGSHTLQVRVTTKNANSSGARVDVDAFVVLG